MTTAEAAPQREAERESAVKGAFWAYAHLAVLSAFALAQPLFDLLKDNPEFFAARGSTGFDIISFAVLAVLLPPAVLLAIELLLGLISRPVRDAAHLVFVGLLVALIAAQALKKSIDASDGVLIGLSVLLGAGAAFAYARAEPVRSFVSVLSPAPLVFLALFLFTDPVSKLAFPEEAGARTVGGVSRAPIVMVLLDELPVTSLMNEQREVDSVRYPAFGRLARESTWFRNAYAIYDSTERAQPAIMDGNYPEEDKLPTSADHPNSIFSLFAKTHRLNVSEEATTVCSRNLCRDERLDESYASRLSSMSEDLGLVWLHVVAPPGLEADLPTVSENWGNFGGDDGDEGGAGAAQSANVRANLNRNRNRRFEAWIDSIEPGRRPSLNFKHSLLPHVPWQYLPSGKQYRRTAKDPVPGLSSEAYNDQGQLDSLYQRHLLQLAFTDRLIGRLLRRLERTGQSDDALIVVAADHGLAFDRGVRDRRRLTRRNAAQIAPVPLFVKAPGQTTGEIDDAYVETIDIVPTIFDVLNLRLPARVDGHSAFSDVVHNRRNLRILERGTFKPIRITGDQFELEKDRQLQKKLRLFGTGADGPGRLFRIGPNQELLGRPARGPGRIPLRVELAAENEFRRVNLRSSTIPAHVVGRVTAPGGGPRDVAIAVNGTIVAVTRTFRLATGGGELVAAMVPESSFRQGVNRVEVLEVGG
jgi:Sulfatase